MYIFWFLHQTTTCDSPWSIRLCCISFDSYIKPQLWAKALRLAAVVYLLIPTSNHNQQCMSEFMRVLYIFWFLHQTTTRLLFWLEKLKLYIFWFLHQTTTCLQRWLSPSGCISFDSYIKPQPYWQVGWSTDRCISFDSYIKPQPVDSWKTCSSVVYLLIPTSNHNSLVMSLWLILLYIFWFLHQTTTGYDASLCNIGCISFDSYIKPQPPRNWKATDSSCISFDSYIKPQLFRRLVRIYSVVYLLIPTSNHNVNRHLQLFIKLYIFWFLHQTTTMDRDYNTASKLYIFWFLHQTTTFSSK